MARYLPFYNRISDKRFTQYSNNTKHTRYNGTKLNNSKHKAIIYNYKQNYRTFDVL